MTRSLRPLRQRTSKLRGRARRLPRLGTGPAWAVLSLCIAVLMFYWLSPANAMERPCYRYLLRPGDMEMIDAPMLVVADGRIFVDGNEVKLDGERLETTKVVPLEPLRAALRKTRLRYPTKVRTCGPPPRPTIVYRMEATTPAALVQSVDEAGRAAGFTERYFLAP